MGFGLPDQTIRIIPVTMLYAASPRSYGAVLMSASPSGDF
jgi:hypothetical protein